MFLLFSATRTSVPEIIILMEIANAFVRASGQRPTGQWTRWRAAEDDGPNDWGMLANRSRHEWSIQVIVVTRGEASNYNRVTASFSLAINITFSWSMHISWMAFRWTWTCIVNGECSWWWPSRPLNGQRVVVLQRGNLDRLKWMCNCGAQRLISLPTFVYRLWPFKSREQINEVQKE